MTLRLNGSTSGYTEIDAPAVAGSNTLVLPTGNGTSGQVLTTNGSGALSWALPGKILQVVQATYAPGGSVATTSTSYVNSGIECSITPTSSSNKILVLSNFILGNSSANWNYVSIFRGATNLASALQAGQPHFGGIYNNSAGDFHNSSSVMYLDSPATTSATTYYVKFRSGNGNSVRICTDGIPSVIVLMEVAA